MTAVKKSLICMILFLALSKVPAFCAEQENSISNYDVTVRINTDGSLDITENIKYSSLSGYNNVVLLIDKQNWEEIQIKNVYMLESDGYIKCTELSEEQWDVNAFMGTYSVTEELNSLRLKIYGRFTSKDGSIVVQYTVKNAIRRYNDVAEYKRSHIFKKQDNSFSDIDISVYLPIKAKENSIKAFLHGVLVGQKNTEDNRIVHFNIPDTVPKEYVELRIVFPEHIVFNMPLSDSEERLYDILEEEEEYNNSDKSDLLKAREDAAKEDARRELLKKLDLRAKIIFAVLSIISSAIGIFILVKFHIKLRRLKKVSMAEDLIQIEVLTPSEVRLIVSRGKTGARGLLGDIFYLVSLGALNIELIKTENRQKIMTFHVNKNYDDRNLSQADKYLISWIADISKKHGCLNPEELRKSAGMEVNAEKLKLVYDEWNYKVIKDYEHKNPLETNLLYYQKLGIITGAMLFFLGCIIPVSLSIWSGYTMLPVGIILFLYSLRLQKHTNYAATQYRIWKEVRNRLSSSNIELGDLPKWIRKGSALLGYSIALRTENNTQLIKDVLDTIDIAHNTKEDINENLLADIIKQTLHIFNKAILSVQDAI